MNITDSKNFCKGVKNLPSDKSEKKESDNQI